MSEVKTNAASSGLVILKTFYGISLQQLLDCRRHSSEERDSCIREERESTIQLAYSGGIGLFCASVSITFHTSCMSWKDLQHRGQASCRALCISCKQCKIQSWVDFSSAFALNSMSQVPWPDTCPSKLELHRREEFEVQEGIRRS